MSNALDLKRYELMVIIDAEIGENDIKKQLDKLRKQITTFEGEIFNEELWGLRKLAYIIKKKSQGYYAVLDFKVEPEHIMEFERKLRLDTDILRHMVSVLPNSYVPKDYVAEEAAAKAKEAEEKAAEELQPGFKPRPPQHRDQSPRPPMRTPEKPVVAAAPVKAEVKEEAKKPAAKKESKQSLADIDAKLNSIIDNPDINL